MGKTLRWEQRHKRRIKRQPLEPKCLNAFDVTRRTLVITDASAEGLGHILMQNRNGSKWQVKTQKMNREAAVTMDTGWVVVQVGSGAPKPVWRNHSALELEATCEVWSLETSDWIQGYI